MCWRSSASTLFMRGGSSHFNGGTCQASIIIVLLVPNSGSCIIQLRAQHEGSVAANRPSMHLHQQGTAQCTCGCCWCCTPPGVASGARFFSAGLRALGLGAASFSSPAGLLASLASNFRSPPSSTHSSYCLFQPCDPCLLKLCLQARQAHACRYKARCVRSACCKHGQHKVQRRQPAHRVVHQIPVPLICLFSLGDLCGTSITSHTRSEQWQGTRVAYSELDTDRTLAV